MFDYPRVSRFFMPMLQDLVLVTEGAESKPVWDLSGIISVSITIITIITMITMITIIIISPCPSSAEARLMVLDPRDGSTKDNLQVRFVFRSWVPGSW